MALQIFTTDTTLAGIVANLGTADSVIVDAGVLIASTGARAIEGTGSEHDVMVLGGVVSGGSSSAILLGDSTADTGQEVTVAASGYVNSDNYGIYMYGDAGLLINKGLIDANLGVAFAGEGTFVTICRNEGSIIARQVAVQAQGDTLLRLVNDGLIAGRTAAITGGGNAVSTIINRGEIDGDILLGGFADTYIGRRGFATGIISGGGGDDTIIGGADQETMAGGTGLDLLTGNGGNDVFLFGAVAENNARITDFSGRAGNNDSFEINATTFGGGLTVGTLAAGQFRTATTNRAGDANDRFIFRTTDETLWFDANGNAAGGRTLIADLQDGARVTAADILLV
jgi:Ca2+-binding RTX toxin-like protein